MAPISTFVSFATLALVAFSSSTSVSAGLHNTRSRQHSAALAARGISMDATPVPRAFDAVEPQTHRRKKRCSGHKSSGGKKNHSSGNKHHSSSGSKNNSSGNKHHSSSGSKDNSSSGSKGSSSSGNKDNSSSGSKNNSSGNKDNSSSGSKNNGSSNGGKDSSSSGSSSSSSGSSSGLESVGNILSGLVGDLTGAIGSWFEADSGRDSTNGKSWCNIAYTNDMPLFAAPFALISPSQATWSSNPSQWEADATKACGLEAEVTYNGNTMKMYIGDAFDMSWVKTKYAIDILKGPWQQLAGESANSKSQVLTDVSWKLTGNRNPEYAFKN